MPITYEGTGAPAAGALGTIDVPYPAGIVAGDQLVLCMTVSSTTNPTLPAGWTNVSAANSGGSSPLEWVSIKTATGSETGNLTVTKPAVNTKAQILLFRGVDQATPIDVAGTTFSSSVAATAYTLPGVTTTRTGVALIAVGSANAATGTWTPPTVPAAFTELTDNPTLVPSTFVGYLIWSGSGATGNVDLTRSTSIRGAAGLIALRPAAAAATIPPILVMAPRIGV